MDIREYLRILRRRWLVVLTMVVLTVGSAAALTFTQEPEYSSSTQLFISTPGSDTAEAYTGGLFSQQRVASYADLADSRMVASRVARAADLDIDPEELADRVTAIAIPETVILQISVTDPDPKTAQRLARNYAVAMMNFVDELENPADKKQAPIKASIAEDADLPTDPASPKPVRNLSLALILGLFLGVAAAVVRDLLDSTVSSPETASASSGAPVVGNIASDSSLTKRPLLSDISSHAPRAEAFRVLRTNLQFLDIDKQSKVITVTSSLPEEGKTHTVVNLAIALAQAGVRTLLIDADLRRPKVAEALGLEGAVGLTTLLLGRASLQEAVQTHSPSGLRVLTSGAVPPNPAELLQSETMAEFVATVRSQCEVVLFDSPPLLPVTDAALLASQSDGAILVVQHGKTTRDQLAASVQRLHGVDARALGIVLNKVPTRVMGGSSYGYGYGYAPTKGRRRVGRPRVEDTSSQLEERAQWQPSNHDGSDVSRSA